MTSSKQLTAIDPALLKNPIYCLALGFGTGLARKAPGTCGTVVAIPIYLMMQPLPFASYCFITFLMFLAGIWICGQTATELKVHDHPGIVWDEIVGYLVTMIMAPLDWRWILIGFVLFRIFDIWKPWPIRSIDQGVSGGFGIMLDDLIAAVYALILMRLLYYLT